MIKLLKFEDFILNENLSVANKILKEQDIKQDNPKFNTIKNIVKSHPGYLGLFTYFHFVENISIPNLSNLYKRLNKNQTILNQLPNLLVDYWKLEIEPDSTVKTNFERLGDDLTKLERSHKAKLYSNKYPSIIRNDVKNDPRFINIINDIDADKNKRESYFNFFLNKISRYKSKEEVLSALQNFISSDEEYDDFLEKIEDRKNTDSDVVVIKEKDKLLVVRVLSFEACQELYSNTSWCIASDL